MPAIGSSLALRSITDKRPMAGRTLIFARHGRTAWNRSGRYQGRTNQPLCDTGRADAETLALSLRTARISEIITSPLERALATARHVAAALDIAAIRVEPRLAEIAFGTWEGRTQAEIRAETPNDLRHWKRSPATMRFPGGETLAEVRARLHAFLADLADDATSSNDGTTLLLTHAGLIRLACLDAAGLDLHHFRTIVVEPGSFRRFILNCPPCRRDGAISFLSETVE